VTVFGVDISPAFQGSLNVASLPAAGISYLSCKVTEGAGWYKASYHDFSAAAKQAGLLFGAYHFLRSESSGAAQADWCRQCMGDDWGTVPLMLDWETSVANTDASAATANAFVARARQLGGLVTQVYCPAWFWPRIGSPSLTAGPIGDLALVQSSYVAGTGSAAVLYPGDASPRWAGFGGKPVSILQFSSRCTLPGYAGTLDINAFRGSRAQLAATGWFYDPQEAIMALGTITIDQDIAALTGNVYKVGQQVPVERFLEVIFQRADNAGATAGKAGAAAVKAITDAAAAEVARDTVEAQTLARIEDKLAHLVDAVAGIPGADTTALSTRITGDLIAAAGRIRLTVETADTPGAHASGV
jgi:GH25 family lysozyme M1 (1,4-beta-N-acetylmuramidase)